MFVGGSPPELTMTGFRSESLSVIKSFWLPVKGFMTETNPKCIHLLFLYLVICGFLICQRICCFCFGCLSACLLFSWFCYPRATNPTLSRLPQRTWRTSCGLKVPQSAAAGSGFGVSLWAITSATAPWTWTHPDRFFFNLRPFQTFWPQSREMSLMIP